MFVYNDTTISPMNFVLLETGPVAIAIAYMLLHQRGNILDKIVDARENIFSAFQNNCLTNFKTEKRFVKKDILAEFKI